MYNAGVMENAHLLRLMGVDRWRLRTAAAPLQDSHAAVAAASNPVTPLSAPDDSPAPNTPRERNAPLQDAAAQQARVQPVVETAPVAPFTAVCLSVEGAMLVIDLPDRRLPGRFCTDLLLALGGAASEVPAQVVFNWPQPGIEPGTGNSGRALAGFLDKQLEDAAPRHLLICEETSRRVPEFRWPERALFMPELAKILLDGELKRALWARLRERTPGGNRTGTSAS